MEINNLIKRMPVYHKTYTGVYRGINKKFFPRWSGWELLDNGSNFEEIDKEAIEFYKAFFVFRFKFNLLDSEALFKLLLFFSASEGAKKTLQKINKVLRSNYSGFSIELLEVINSKPIEFTHSLLLEILEFYEYSKRLEEAYWVFSIYREMV